MARPVASADPVRGNRAIRPRSDEAPASFSPPREGAKPKASREAESERFRRTLEIDRAEWDRLSLALEDAIPSYERMNNVMSLGQVGGWRRFTANKARKGEAILEIGSGPGVFGELLKERGVGSMVLLDPLAAMHRAARERVPDALFVGGAGGGEASSASSRNRDSAGPAEAKLPPGPRGTVEFLVGVAERLPLAAGTIDRAFCLFSFRDFLDKRRGLREIKRVLKPGCHVHILEPVKARGLKQALVNMHVNVAVPLLARLFVPPRVQRTWRGNPYRAFAKTYRDFGSPEFYAGLMRDEGFRDVTVERLSLGGAALLSGRG
jgi:ubiquinone/menaquinone biosynthesis C-methylase UbiE